ncbi:BC1872 family protein [Candidatus Methylomirabilis sp.]|uniref:BC1872 family protein n=1 Tax=Candidatus Methylomirabilis sp. TaxID=2032687 RepID=UPI003C7313B9
MSDIETRWAGMTEAERAAWVATDVMGSPKPVGTADDFDDGFDPRPDGCCWFWSEPLDFPGDWQPEPFPSDIAAVWQVVEKMRERGYYLVLNDTMSAYRALFFTERETLRWDFLVADGANYCHAPTPAEAICKASLKCVVGERE